MMLLRGIILAALLLGTVSVWSHAPRCGQDSVATPATAGCCSPGPAAASADEPATCCAVPSRTTTDRRACSGCSALCAALCNHCPCCRQHPRQPYRPADRETVSVATSLALAGPQTIEPMRDATLAWCRLPEPITSIEPPPLPIQTRLARWCVWTT